MKRHHTDPAQETILSVHDRENFVTQVNSEVLAALRELARAEGRQLQALVDEALSHLLEKRRPGRPRQHVVAAYQSSHAKYAKLYKKLAE